MSKSDDHEYSAASASTSRSTPQPQSPDKLLRSTPYGLQGFANDPGGVPYVRLPPKQIEDRRYEFDEFVAKFRPIFEEPNDTLYMDGYPIGEVDESEWWTVCEDVESPLYRVYAGLVRLNVRGYYHCAVRRIGNPRAYPIYHYADLGEEEALLDYAEQLQREMDESLLEYRSVRRTRVRALNS